MVLRKVISTLIASAFIGLAIYQPAQAAVMPRSEIYPLYFVKGTLTLKVPTETGKTETKQFKIAEENRSLTFMTGFPTEGDHTKTEIFFVDGKCILSTNTGVPHKTVYDTYTKDIKLDGEIPAEGGIDLTKWLKEE